MPDATAPRALAREGGMGRDVKRRFTPIVFAWILLRSPLSVAAIGIQETVHIGVLAV